MSNVSNFCWFCWNIFRRAGLSFWIHKTSTFFLFGVAVVLVWYEWWNSLSLLDVELSLLFRYFWYFLRLTQSFWSFTACPVQIFLLRPPVRPPRRPRRPPEPGSAVSLDTLDSYRLTETNFGQAFHAQLTLTPSLESSPCVETVKKPKGLLKMWSVVHKNVLIETKAKSLCICNCIC